MPQDCLCSSQPLFQSTYSETYLEIFSQPSDTIWRQCVRWLCNLRKGSHCSKIYQGLPPLLQPIILQAVLKDTNIDDRGVGAKSIAELFKVKQEIEPILDKGGLFYNQFLGTFQRKILSKYLGMAWDHLWDSYLLKFGLNLHEKACRIPSGADLDSEFLKDHSDTLSRRMSSQ